MYPTNPAEFGQINECVPTSCTRHNTACQPNSELYLKRAASRLWSRRSRGRMAQTASLQFVRHPGSVAILPLLDDGRVCLIHSRRLTVDKTLIEVPGRHTRTERNPAGNGPPRTGRRNRLPGGPIGRVDRVLSSPGILNERMWIYVATRADGRPACPRGERGDRELAGFVGRSAGDDRRAAKSTTARRSWRFCCGNGGSDRAKWQAIMA